MTRQYRDAVREAGGVLDWRDQHFKRGDAVYVDDSLSGELIGKARVVRARRNRLGRVNYDVRYTTGQRRGETEWAMLEQITGWKRTRSEWRKLVTLFGHIRKMAPHCLVWPRTALARKILTEARRYEW